MTCDNRININYNIDSINKGKYIININIIIR